MKKYSLHLCDDHPILACSLAELLGKEPFVQSVNVSHHFEALVSALETSSIDLLLLDVSFKGVTIFEILGKIKTTFPDVKSYYLQIMNCRTYYLRPENFK